MHEVLLARAAVKRSQGRPRAKYRAAKRVYFRGADLVPLKRRQHRPMTYWLAWDEPRAVGDLVHVETFFARNLGGLIHARTRMPGRLGMATSHTSSMHVDEKSEEAIVTCEATEHISRRKSWREGPHPRGAAVRRPRFGH